MAGEEQAVARLIPPPSGLVYPGLSQEGAKRRQDGLNGRGYVAQSGLVPAWLTGLPAWGALVLNSGSPEVCVSVSLVFC